MIKKAFFAVLAAGMALFSACFSPWAGDEGSFAIRIGNGTPTAKLIVSDWRGGTFDTDSLSHTITVTGNGITQTKSCVGDQIVSFTVIAGTYDISIESMLGGKLEAEGYASKDIKPGQNGNVAIQMTPAYEIGDTGPAGGTIFYVNRAGFTVLGFSYPDGDSGYFRDYTARYLEAAPADVGQSTWGDIGNQVAGVTAMDLASTGQYIGHGRKDTRLIAAHMNGKSITGTAAQECVNMSEGGYNDWFLPSLDELRLLAHSGASVIGLANQTYWTSTQWSNDWAWVWRSSDDTEYYDVKSMTTFYVHAIRAF